MKSTKKLHLLTIIFTTLLVLTSCRANTEIKIDYGTSTIYTKADMDEAIELIKTEFSKWEGCELHNIRYTSDDCNKTENINWMNDLNKGCTPYTQCIEFVSDFHSPKKGGGAWNPNSEYENWGWWLARTDGGKWEMVTWGY